MFLHKHVRRKVDTFEWTREQWREIDWLAELSDEIQDR